MANTIENILAALSRTHAAVCDPAERRQAQEFLIQLERLPDVHELAFRLLKEVQGGDRRMLYGPEVSHFAFQLLQKAIKAQYATKWQAGEREVVKKLLIVDLLTTTGAGGQDQINRGVSSSSITLSAAAANPVPWLFRLPKFVRAKWAACVVECAKHDWPGQWPELLPILGNLRDEPDIAVLVVRLLADTVADQLPSKDLAIKRKKEIVQALVQRTADLFGLIENAKVSDVEKIFFIRAFTSIFGLSLLLQRRVDEALMQLLQSREDLREEVLLTFAEWSVTPLFRHKVQKIQQQNLKNEVSRDDVARLCRNLTRLCEHSLQKATWESWAQSDCLFSEDDVMAQHRQIVSILKDFVMTNAESLHREFVNSSTPPATSTPGNGNNSTTMLNPAADLWQALLVHCGRYPSYFIGSEAFLALKTLLKPWKGIENMNFLNLEQFVEVCLLRMWKPSVASITTTASSSDPSKSSRTFYLTHPIIRQCLQERVAGDSQKWIAVLQKTKAVEQEVLDYSTNSEIGLIKNCVNGVLQTLAEVGGESFFVPLVGKVREVIRLLLTDQSESTATKVGVLEAALSFLTKLTPYIVAKMTKELKASKKHLEEGRQARVAPPAYPNLCADPGPCVDNVLQLINELVGYDFMLENTTTAGAASSRVVDQNITTSSVQFTRNMVASVMQQLGQHSQAALDDRTTPAWLKLETARLDFVGQVSTIYPLRPQVVVPVLDYLFQKIEFQPPRPVLSPQNMQELVHLGANNIIAGSAVAQQHGQAAIERALDKVQELTRQEVQRKALACLTTMCKNGQKAVLVHLDALIQKAERVHGSLSKNNQQLLMQSLVAAASSDFAKQKQIVALASAEKVQDWTSGQCALLCRNEGDSLRHAFRPQRSEIASEKSKYFAEVKALSGALQTFMMILKHTSVTGISPYILRDLPGDHDASNHSTGSEQGTGPSNSTSSTTTGASSWAGTGDAIVERANPAADLVRQVTPNLLVLMRTFCRNFPSDWLSSETAFVEDGEWIMIMGNAKAQESEGAAGGAGSTSGSGQGVGEQVSSSSSTTASMATSGVQAGSQGAGSANSSPAGSNTTGSASFGPDTTARICFAASNRDDYDREAGAWIFNLRFAALRTLAACAETADGFWQLPGILPELSSFINDTFPTMSPHEMELFYKHVFPAIFGTAENAISGKNKLLSNATAEAICSSDLLPTLVQQTVACFAKYEHLLVVKQDATTSALVGTGTGGPARTTSSSFFVRTGLLAKYPMFDNVAVTSVLSLARVVASSWTRLVVCGFGGAHSTVLIDYSGKVEARPFSWVDFLFSSVDGRTTRSSQQLLEGILYLLKKVPDPEAQQRFCSALRIYMVQLWCTGCLHAPLRLKELQLQAANGNLVVQNGDLANGLPHQNGKSSLGTLLGTGNASRTTALCQQQVYSGGNAENLLSLAELVPHCEALFHESAGKVLTTILEVIAEPIPKLSTPLKIAIEKRFRNSS
ncbi:unnamed protein product [Amoebophrya sp. A25]|nr:unnamed protein product [Amoebophrya sp. A25]|eukprot:GSA25T00017923001.1